jgi:hypothetical protein
MCLLKNEYFLPFRLEHNRDATVGKYQAAFGRGLLICSINNCEAYLDNNVGFTHTNNINPAGYSVEPVQYRSIIRNGIDIGSKSTA